MSRLLSALLAGALSIAPAAAQTRTVELTDQQIDSIIQAGASCLEKLPYACARYAIFIHDLLAAAKQKPAADRQQ